MKANMFLQTHLPGYVADADSLKAKGINEIVCVSVNDPFVMDAWGAAHNAKDKVNYCPMLLILFYVRFF